MSLAPVALPIAEALALATAAVCLGFFAFQSAANPL